MTGCSQAWDRVGSVSNKCINLMRRSADIDWDGVAHRLRTNR